jgi:hypothetical protein
MVALAERRHGVVTLPQLQLLGLGKGGVAKRAREGRLHGVHRGVYSVGKPRLGRRGRWMAAVLAYSPRAVLSHHSAAALHGLRPTDRARIDVTVPSPSARPRPGKTSLPSPAVVVETDSRRFHSHRKAFEHDRLRDQRLTLAGYTVVRFTWRQVADDPRAVAQALQGLLARLARP